MNALSIRRQNIFVILYVASGFVYASNNDINFYNLEKNSTFIQRVFVEICHSGVAYPNIVMRQAILETGWFKSNFLMKRNNLFAFKKKHYLAFAKWQDSVSYYKKWQDRRYKEGVYADYYDFLSKIKYGSESYLEHLHKIEWNSNCPEE